MKKFRILAVVALLMLFGCSKDNLIDTEQTPFSVEENNQTSDGEKRGLDTPRWRDIFFELTSINDNSYVLFETLQVPHDINNLKILNSGYFYGKMMGFGVIDPSKSKYDFTSCKIVVDSRPDWGGEWMFYVEIIGAKVSLTDNDYFYLDIKGDLRPWFGYLIGIDSSWFEGTATSRGGQGKFSDFDNQNFKVGGILSKTNLNTGVVTWYFRLIP
ncbi:MAG: hypothetical protein Q7U08_03990 [Flavobacteriaceae bacterium]|jgi:hypothetical protein|nr:hypothetical protein [Flavobacteriaceae bacterium]